MSKKDKKIELLAPAGDLERLKTAITFGADAVYAGLPNWSLRNAREITFNIKTIKEGIKFTHDHGKKVYLTFNVFPHESMLGKIEKDLEKIAKLDIDGIIVADLGMLSLIKKHLPKIPIHISTQANTVNSEAIKAYKELGAKRIVLARELTLKEIEKIKKVAPDMTIETFGHGAMCIAYSGRCLLSKFYTNREANLGNCAQSCRWKYKIKKSSNQEIIKTEKHYLEEELRLNNLVEVQEDKNGTYFLNSQEIATIDILNKFIESGIDALKVEGRAKSVYYLATVIRAYREAIDAYYNGKYDRKLVNRLQKELELLDNRGYSHGFLVSKDEYGQTYDVAAYKSKMIFSGIVLDQKKNLVQIEVKNKFKVGDKIEIITPEKILKLKIEGLVDNKKNNIDEVLTPQEIVLVRFDKNLEIPKRSIMRKRK